MTWKKGVSIQGNSFYHIFVYSICVGDKDIKTKNGFRQGCCLSATLFIAVMALLTKGIPELYVVYADDLCIVIDDNMDANGVIISIKVKGERFG